MSASDDLVVVGAGPVGLSTALAARSLGIRVTLLEAEPQDRARPGSRALYVHRETLARLEGMSPGMGARIAAFGITWGSSRTCFAGHEVYAQQEADASDIGSRFLAARIYAAAASWPSAPSISRTSPAAAAGSAVSNWCKDRSEHTSSATSSAACSGPFSASAICTMAHVDCPLGNMPRLKTASSIRSAARPSAPGRSPPRNAAVASVM